jgi:hypothetical protein
MQNPEQGHRIRAARHGDAYTLTGPPHRVPGNCIQDPLNEIG